MKTLSLWQETTLHEFKLNKCVSFSVSSVICISSLEQNPVWNLGFVVFFITKKNRTVELAHRSTFKINQPIHQYLEVKHSSAPFRIHKNTLFLFSFWAPIMITPIIETLMLQDALICSASLLINLPSRCFI